MTAAGSTARAAGRERPQASEQDNQRDFERGGEAIGQVLRGPEFLRAPLGVSGGGGRCVVGGGTERGRPGATNMLTEFCACVQGSIPGLRSKLCNRVSANLYLTPCALAGCGVLGFSSTLRLLLKLALGLVAFLLAASERCLARMSSGSFGRFLWRLQSTVMLRTHLLTDGPCGHVQVPVGGLGHISALTIKGPVQPSKPGIALLLGVKHTEAQGLRPGVGHEADFKARLCPWDSETSGAKDSASQNGLFEVSDFRKCF